METLTTKHQINGKCIEVVAYFANDHTDEIEFFDIFLIEGEQTTHLNEGDPWYLDEWPTRQEIKDYVLQWDPELFPEES